VQARRGHGLVFRFQKESDQLGLRRIEGDNADRNPRCGGPVLRFRIVRPDARSGSPTARSVLHCQSLNGADDGLCLDVIAQTLGFAQARVQLRWQVIASAGIGWVGLQPSAAWEPLSPLRPAPSAARQWWDSDEFDRSVARRLTGIAQSVAAVKKYVREKRR